MDDLLRLEAMLKEQFMAGKNLGMKQGVDLVRITLDTVYEANLNKSLSHNVVMVVIQSCLDQIEEQRNE